MMKFEQQTIKKNNKKYKMQSRAACIKTGEKKVSGKKITRTNEHIN